MPSFRFAVLAPLALASVLCLPSALNAQAKVLSDAQVEADVLKAFAADPRVAHQPINTSTVYGVVTITGSVSTEDARNAAEQIASRTPGVKKVVDQLTVGATQAAEGTDPSAVNTMSNQDAYPQQAPYGQQAPYSQQTPYSQPGAYPQTGQYPQQANGYPSTSGSYGNQPYGAPSAAPGYAGPGYGQQPYAQGYPEGGYPDQQAGAYPPPPPRRLYRRDYERQMAAGQQGMYAQQQGQPGGQLVTVPGDTILPVSINHWLSSDDAAPGSGFTALVATDILANGQIAIPRGALVEGTVLDAKGAGALKGRGTLTLQLTALQLGGQRVPLQSLPFTVTGHDKAARSVGSTIVGAGIGALLGAAIGRGTGAAIGAGVGGAAGLGTAAASNGGQAALRPEELLQFHLTAPTQLTTVSEAEMQRLAGGAGPYAGRGGPSNGYGSGAYPYPAVGAYPAPYPYGRY